MQNVARIQIYVIKFKTHTLRSCITEKNGYMNFPFTTVASAVINFENKLTIFNPIL